ncbi:macrophage mannose receptor 1-like [Gouania willdenowi]|uniref:macrophage mannose receptor 1-like n=1 Tax=Gouania willdenowi TaxID=441366 RepID=UPI0010548637|nr:macrophage mannose receptor 1-like [Gouania willdenowi]
MHLIVLFVGFGLTLCSDVYVRQYHYVDLELSWTNAQLHCREKFSDLATFSSSDDLSRLPETTFRAAWFGMTDHSKSWKNIFNNDSNSWKWSASGEWSVPSYQNWFPGQPDNDGSAQTCVYVLGGGKWIDGYCEEKKNFVCFNGTLDQKTYHLIKDSKKWKEARDYCREHHIDLAMIESQRENEQFLLEKHTPLVWIGMYRVPWRWSDGSTSLFRNWRDGQPNNFNGEQHCGVIKMSHVWDDDNCDNAKPFFCQKNLKVRKIKIVKVKLQSTTGNLSDPRSHSFILQKLEDELMKNTVSIRVSLKWKTEPGKQRIKEDYKEDCNNSFF